MGATRVGPSSRQKLHSQCTTTCWCLLYGPLCMEPSQRGVPNSSGVQSVPKDPDESPTRFCCPLRLVLPNSFPMQGSAHAPACTATY